MAGIGTVAVREDFASAETADASKPCSLSRRAAKMLKTKRTATTITRIRRRGAGRAEPDGLGAVPGGVPGGPGARRGRCGSGRGARGTGPSRPRPAGAGPPASPWPGHPWPGRPWLGRAGLDALGVDTGLGHPWSWTRWPGRSWSGRSWSGRPGLSSPGRLGGTGRAVRACRRSTAWGRGGLPPRAAAPTPLAGRGWPGREPRGCVTCRPQVSCGRCWSATAPGWRPGWGWGGGHGPAPDGLGRCSGRRSWWCWSSSWCARRRWWSW